MIAELKHWGYREHKPIAPSRPKGVRKPFDIAPIAKELREFTFAEILEAVPIGKDFLYRRMQEMQKKGIIEKFRIGASVKYRYIGK